VNDVKSLTSQESVEAFGHFRRLRQVRAAYRETQGYAARYELTLGDRRERRRRVCERDLIVDGVVSLAGCVSLHRGTSIERSTRNFRVDWKHVKARISLRTTTDQRVDDRAGMDSRWEAGRREHDLELIANPDDAVGTGSCTGRADDGIDKEIGDIVAVGYGCYQP
jgi:hypothetical protein